MKNETDGIWLHVDYICACSVGEECTEEVASLLDVCLRTRVEERPSAKDLVSQLQALPPQPNARARKGSAQSFVSPLDQAAHASSGEDSSVLSASTNSGPDSQSASNFKFYQVRHALHRDCNLQMLTSSRGQRWTWSHCQHANRLICFNVESELNQNGSGPGCPCSVLKFEVALRPAHDKGQVTYVLYVWCVMQSFDMSIFFCFFCCRATPLDTVTACAAPAYCR